MRQEGLAEHVTGSAPTITLHPSLAESQGTLCVPTKSQRAPMRAVLLPEAASAGTAQTVGSFHKTTRLVERKTGFLRHGKA